MKDVDLGRNRPFYQRTLDSTQFRINWTCLHYDDARTGFGYLTSAECEEINAACDAFFKRKGMKYGTAYMKQVMKHQQNKI